MAKRSRVWLRAELAGVWSRRVALALAIAGVGVSCYGSSKITPATVSVSGYFRHDKIQHVAIKALVPGKTLSDLATELGIARSSDEKQFLERWPKALQEALRAVLLNAAERKQPISLNWAPGYDFEMRIWEARPTATTMGHITIHLRSRYPDE